MDFLIYFLTQTGDVGNYAYFAITHALRVALFFATNWLIRKSLIISENSTDSG